MKKSNVNMLSGSITKGLITLIIPIMIMNVFQSLIGVIDMTVLGILVDDNAVGAVGTCGTLISLITGLIIGVSTGANVVVAKHVATGNKEKVERSVGTALFFAILMGVILAVFGIVFAEMLLVSINCPESLLPMATNYFRLYFAGVPLLFLYNFSASILRSIGDTKRPMYFMCGGGILKVIFNFVLTISFNFTVEGVGIATIVSWLFAGILCLRLLMKKDSKAPFKFKNFRFYFKELGNMLFIGIPLGLQSVMYSFANVAITATVNALGPEATKGMSIANQYDAIMYHIAMAPSYAIAAYVSQNVAAKNVQRAKKAIYTAISITFVLGASLGGLMALCSKPLCLIMTKNPEVIKYAQQKMVIISTLYFLVGVADTLGSALRAIEKPIFPTITTLLFMCLIRFPWVWYVYPLLPSLTFLYLIWPIGWVLSISVLAPILIYNMKKVKQRVDKLIEEEKATEELNVA